MNYTHIAEQARGVLALNDLGEWTRPTAKLYPHQWLWDSCFIAIGLRHIDLQRAQNEIRSLLRGQWKNGMLPYIIFGQATTYHAGPKLWRCHLSPDAPADVETCGGTQPPMLAEAVVRIGELLPAAKRKAWYSEVYPAIARYHEWLYRERDPDRTGLVALMHPWESGLDNTPPWMEILHTHALSYKLRLVDKSRALMRFLERLRKDTSIVPASQRMSTLDLLAFYDIVRQMRRAKYDHKRLFATQKLLVVDLITNCILIRANQHLATIAKTIDEDLPPLTAQAHAHGIELLDQLWDTETNSYYSRDYRTGQLIKVPSIATFMPLYAGKLHKDKVKALMGQFHNPKRFGAKYLVPTTPLDSPYFKPQCYWQGPIWINTNWLIIRGLRQNDQDKEADELQAATLELIANGGMHEYFSPLDGTPAGAPNFSWTAALALDLLNEQQVLAKTTATKMSMANISQ